MGITDEIRDAIGFRASISNNMPEEYDVWTPKHYYNWMDIGCGKKHEYVNWLSENRPEWDILGIDINLEQTIVTPKLELIKAKASNVLNKLHDNSIDGVSAFLFFTNLDGKEYKPVLQLLSLKVRNNAIFEYGVRCGHAGDTRRWCAMNTKYKLIEDRPFSDIELSYSPSARYHKSNYDKAEEVNLWGRKIKDDSELPWLLKYVIKKE